MQILFFTKNWIGDVIFAEPLIRIVKKQFPQSRILVACPPRCRSFLLRNPYIDNVLSFDEKGDERSLIRRIFFMLRLRKLKIDRVYLLHRSFSRALICYIAGIRERIGYNTKGRGILLTVSYPLNITTTSDEHDVDRFLRLSGKADLSADEKEYRFYFSQDDSSNAAALLTECGLTDNKFIVLNPGANWVPKRWPTEYFACLADLLYERFSLPIVITGHRDNQILAEDISACTRYKQCRSLCGCTTLPQVGAVFARSLVIVTADSGPMHIASGVGAPVVALFGPTDFCRTGPRGVGEKIIVHKRDEKCAIPCYESACTAFTCMSNITPQMVVEAVERIVTNRI